MIEQCCGMPAKLPCGCYSPDPWECWEYRFATWDDGVEMDDVDLDGMCGCQCHWPDHYHGDEDDRDRRERKEKRKE